MLGFVVGLALSFRSSTAYERLAILELRSALSEWQLIYQLSRWADGRKYWAQLVQTSRNLARTIWVNTGEREGEDGKVDLLRKMYGVPNDRTQYL